MLRKGPELIYIINVIGVADMEDEYVTYMLHIACFGVVFVLQIY